MRPLSALAILVPLVAALALCGCGGGVPLSDAETHLAAGRLERASEVLRAYDGAEVEALRARIAARAAERATALAQIDALEAARGTRVPGELLDDLRAIVAGSRDPVVKEHAEVVLSTTYDWAAEHRSSAARSTPNGHPIPPARAGNGADLAPPPAGRGVTPSDPVAAAALREFERHRKERDWRRALDLADRWARAQAVDENVRRAFEAWRAAALADATLEADELVVRAWRLETSGQRQSAIDLLAGAVERFPVAQAEPPEGKALGGVARALAELRGVAPGDDLGLFPTNVGEPTQIADAARTDDAATSAGAATTDAATTDAAGQRRAGERAAQDEPAVAQADVRPTTPPVTERAPSEASRGPAAATGGAHPRRGDGKPSVASERLAPESARKPYDELARRLVAADTSAERDAAFTELFVGSKGSADGREALSGALTARFERSLKRLERVGSLRKLERVAERRAALDAAREAALALIFDEEQYFYPYTTPHVTPERAATYDSVQRRVDEVVAAVGSIWDASPKARIPEVLQAELQELAWLRRRGGLASGPMVLPANLPAWIEALPRDRDEVDLGTFAWTVDEARQLARDRAVVARNEALWNELDADRTEGDQVAKAAEREQVRVTNAYRAQMGRPALAWHPALQSAARGHSHYMNATGEFGHDEVDPARRSPFDRMRAVGYLRGVSENCQMGSGAPEGAHKSWLASSGHHRNLLMSGHKEMASAVAGGYWTQNFGLDTHFEQYLDLSGWRD